MRPMNEAWCMLIDITNKCGRGCLYCTRWDRHIPHDKRYAMDPDYFEKALISVKDYPTNIGIIGGEPGYHPEFTEIMRIVRKHIQKERAVVFTADPKMNEKYNKDMNKTFGINCYNEHSKDKESQCRHQPLTIAINDAVHDKQIKRELIDNCWVQRTWCPTINNLGGFFCEVGAALAVLLDYKGYDLSPGWWNKTPEQFKDQVDALCGYCGAAIPMDRQYLSDPVERISPSLLALFVANDYPLGNYKPFLDKFTRTEIEIAKKTWRPWNYFAGVSDELYPEDWSLT